MATNTVRNLGAESPDGDWSAVSTAEHLINYVGELGCEDDWAG
ncbi:hypothetical protein [Mycobacterium leprae]|nr:hypothetical protein [Mycobacterium leprae]